MITCPVPGLKGTSVTNKEASIPPVMPPDAKPHTSSVLLSLVQLSLTHHPLSAFVFFSRTCSNSSPDKNCSLHLQPDAPFTQREWECADAITSSLPRMPSTLTTNGTLFFKTEH